jgi:hypothetical protein
MHRPTWLFALCLAALTVAAGGGCTPSIGDGCKTNVDCSRLGDRFCDTSAPDGYCTVDGCNQGTCPDGALCIRFLTADLDRPCFLDRRSPDNLCRPDERCVCDKFENGVCLGTPPNNAHCAAESTERRFCQKPCNSNSDCRDRYECRSTGTLGSELVPSLTDVMSPATANFCAPAQ